jgi:hypothetical protein
MIIFVSVSMFDHKPERCPFGHSLWHGMAQGRVATLHLHGGAGGGWAGPRHGAPLGVWQTTFYQPPHDINHHQPGPW